LFAVRVFLGVEWFKTSSLIHRRNEKSSNYYLLKFFYSITSNYIWNYNSIKVSSIPNSPVLKWLNHLFIHILISLSDDKNNGISVFSRKSYLRALTNPYLTALINMKSNTTSVNFFIIQLKI